jgi:hypothetical protein
MDLGFGFGSFPSHHHRETMFDGQTRAAAESVANVRRTDSVLQPLSQAMVTTDGRSWCFIVESEHRFSIF